MKLFFFIRIAGRAALFLERAASWINPPIFSDYFESSTSASPNEKRGFL